MPRTRGRQPRWEQRSWSGGDKDVRDGVLHAVVSGDGKIPGTLAIDQDAAIYVAKLSPGQEVTHTSVAGRHAYMFVIDGGVTLNSATALAKGDQARIADEPTLAIRADSNAHVILLDLP